MPDVVRYLGTSDEIRSRHDPAGKAEEVATWHREVVSYEACIVELREVVK